MKDWLRKNIFMHFKDDNVERIYLKSIYSYRKFLISQIFILIFTILNLILNSNSNISHNINCNDAKNLLEPINNNDRIKIFCIILISLDLLVLIIYITINRSKIIHTDIVLKFTRFISLISFYNLLVQSQISKEVLKYKAHEFVLEIIIPNTSCVLVIFYVYWMDHTKCIIVYSFILYLITIVGLSFGYNYIDDWISILFIIALGCLTIYFSLTIEKFNRKYFTLINNPIKENNENGEFIENMNYGYLYLSKDKTYHLNSKMKDYLNIYKNEMDLDYNSSVLEKIHLFLMQGNYEFSPNIDEHLKLILSYNKNEMISDNLDTIEVTSSYKNKTYNYNDVLDLIKNDCKYKQFVFIGNKLLNKFMLRIHIRYRKIDDYLEVCANDISSIIEIEDLKASNRYKKLFLNKFSHEFKNPLLNIKQIINNIKIKNKEDIENTQARSPSNKLPRSDETNIFCDHSSNAQNNLNVSALLSVNNIKINPVNKKLDYSELIDLAHIKNLSNYMISLIGDFDFISNSYFKNFSQDNSNLKFIEIGKFKLEKLIKSCIRIFKTRVELNDKNIKFSYEIDKLVPEFLNSDFRRIKQIILNILSNSYKFTNNGEISINVRLDREPNFVFFEIKDTGTGFNFTKEENLNLKEGEINNNIYGMGLGLKIVKILISLLGNNFQISSKERNGTTVSFSLMCDANFSKNQTLMSNSINNETDTILLKNETLTDVPSLFNINSKLTKVKTTLNKLNSENFSKNYTIGKKPIEKKINRSVTINDNLLNLTPARTDLFKKISELEKISKFNKNLADTEEKMLNNSTLKWEPHLINVKNIQLNNMPRDLVKNLENGQFSSTFPAIPKIEINSNLDELQNKMEPIKLSINQISVNDYNQVPAQNIKNQNPHNNSNSEPIRILLVDDEKLIRQSEFHIISKYFKKLNIPYEITECSDGVECIYQIYKGGQSGIKYDFIITDETMNFMRGSLMAKTLRMLMADNMMHPLKIFMVTSYEASSITKQFCDIVDSIVTKPLSQELVMKIFNHEIVDKI